MLKKTPPKMIFEEFKKQFNKKDEKLANYVYLLYMRETETTDPNTETTDPNTETTDPNTDSSVSEPLLDQTITGSPAQYRAGRLYQFSTKPNYQNEVIFGTIFELSCQKESKDLEIILKKLEKEIEHLNNIGHDETSQGKLVIEKAIENIKTLQVWKLEEFTTENGIPYIQKIKIGNYESIKQGVENAKKSQ